MITCLAKHAITLTIAVSIALELGGSAGLLELRDAIVALRFVCTVQTFAFFAELEIFGTTAVTAIPITTSVVAAQNHGMHGRGGANY